jgi:PadR family transcriptional regulator, regulatory protein PadR
MSTKENRERIELLQGTLDLLILRTLLLGPTHGHAIAKAIEFNSDAVLQVEQGSLYPALHRLIKRGWISPEGGTSENNRRAKFYRLTPKGRRQLALDSQMGRAGGRDRAHSPADRAGGSILSRRRRMLDDLEQDMRDHIDREKDPLESTLAKVYQNKRFNSLWNEHVWKKPGRVPQTDPLS